MGAKRKVTIIKDALDKIAESAWYVESKSSDLAAKKFVDDVLVAIGKLSRYAVRYHPCFYKPWRTTGYLCFTFRKKYVIAYLEFENEIIVCDFSHVALLI